MSEKIFLTHTKGAGRVIRRTAEDELTIRTVGKGIAFLAVCGAALIVMLHVYMSHRHSNVSKIIVSKLTDFDETFEVNASSLRVRNPEFLKVCFAGDYVYALKDARQWFAADENWSRRFLRRPAD